MGLPTNIEASKKGCTPISSSCVIWQGKDIDCLEICKGNSIDDVMHQIGCMLCTINEQLDVDTYDLDCFDLEPCDTPRSYRELMQFLIERMCQLESGFLNGPSVSGSTTTDTGLVTVASCFQADGINQSISDYLIAIGKKVCEMEVTQKNMLNSISQMQAEIELLKA